MLHVEAQSPPGVSDYSLQAIFRPLGELAVPAQEEQAVVKRSPVVAATAVLAVPGVPAGGASLHAVS